MIRLLDLLLENQESAVTQASNEINNIQIEGLKKLRTAPKTIQNKVILTT